MYKDKPPSDYGYLRNKDIWRIVIDELSNTKDLTALLFASKVIGAIVRQSLIQKNMIIKAEKDEVYNAVCGKILTQHGEPLGWGDDVRTSFTKRELNGALSKESELMIFTDEDQAIKFAKQRHEHTHLGLTYAPLILEVKFKDKRYLALKNNSGFEYPTVSKDAVDVNEIRVSGYENMEHCSHSKCLIC